MNKQLLISNLGWFTKMHLNHLHVDNS